MLVSIIIPVYNTENFIKECIESAINQTYPDIEIIVINDGSTDNSLRIINEFDGKIKIISKSNGGTASALNTGIRNMKGEWFKWLSADDVLYPNAIQDLIEETKKIDFAKNCILYSNYDIIDSNGKIIKKFIEPNYNSMKIFDVNTILLDHYVGNATTSLIHKSAFDKFGLFDEDLGFAEDYELWLRLCILRKYRLHLIPRVLAKYRIHGGQLTSKKIDQTLQNAVRIKKHVIDQLDEDEKKEYLAALKNFKRSRPFIVRARHGIRDAMFKIFPKPVSQAILHEYFKRK